MSHPRVSASLAALFATHPVVFWHDIEAEFALVIDSLLPEGVQLVRLDDTPTLQIKIDIARTPHQHRLIYSTQPEPEPIDDWLLDVRLRSKSFRADTASILLEDLGLASQALRPHLKARAKFLRTKERVDRLKRWVLPSDTAPDLDRKMLAVLTRADQPELFAILQRLLAALAVDGQDDLAAVQPKAWLEVVANDLAPTFWALVQAQLGYTEPEPTLHHLLVQLLVTDMCRTLDADVPPSLAHFVLPDRALAANASVFAARWRSDMAFLGSYNLLAQTVAKTLALAPLLSAYATEALADVMTFEDVELRIVQDLKQRIEAGAGANMDAVHSLIARRRDGYWANPLLANAHERSRPLVACYEALTAAADFFSLKARHAGGFSFADAAIGWAQYRGELYRFDQLYRHFNAAADVVEPLGWSILQGLRTSIEGAYSGWFMPQLGAAWAKVLEGEQGLLKHWAIPEVTPQQKFYQSEVLPLSSAGTKRVFVVISDALRYEVAQELVDVSNGKNRIKASLGAMLGVLPSYTGLGMAALLPHQTLAYAVNGVNTEINVLADGKSVATTDQRNKHLSAFGGIAIKADDLLALGKQKGREWVGEHKLIYIYHDLIDMLGDKQASESKTFQAAAETVQELSKLLGFILNSLNGSTVLVTADHGFIYQDALLDGADKATLEDKPAGTIKAKKRYLIGHKLGTNAKVWAGNTAITAGTMPEHSLDFWLPKGASRFHFAGGARFVHGSAMLQEVVIPLITVRTTEADHAKTRPVNISLLGNVTKIVTSSQRFEFIQNDAVSERVLARTVVLSLRDGDKLISDEQTLTFDSTSNQLNEGKRSTFLTVLTGAHDPHHSYDLVVRDAITKVELLRLPIKVDLAFGSDF